MESGNNSIFIILFIVASFFGIYAVAKYLGFSLRPDLADRVASRKDNLKLRFKKTFNYYINKLINTIIVFKTRKRLYLISDFEEKRRDKILQRYYILRDSYSDYKNINLSKQIIVLTDGDINVGDDIIDLIKLHNNEFRIHLIGMGHYINEKTIIDTSKVGNGSYHIINDASDLIRNKAFYYMDFLVYEK